MKTVAIIQARMGSTRLPGKVIRVLGDRTVLAHVIGRASEARGVDGVVVATTESVSDQAVVDEAVRAGAGVFRGSELDVLARYQGAATTFGAERIVRITSDCPLLDPDLLGRMLTEFDLAGRSDAPLDYMSNALERTFPRGLDAEVFTRAALERAFHEASRPYEREHVTPYLYEHPELFRLRAFRGPADHSHYRLTLDTHEDWALLSAIFSELQRPGHRITTDEVIGLLRRRPELVALNADVWQKVLHS